MRRVLIVAGSDSSGGAGLEADQKVIAAHKCYAMTATTALTAQSTLGVFGIHEVPPEFVRQQMELCFDDIGVDVVKTGMLASSETISAVAEVLSQNNVAHTIVDPVMVSTSGAALLQDTAINTMLRELLPLTYLLTPNIPEANLLLREAGRPEIEVVDLVTLKQLAAAVRTLGPRYVLLKGGHSPLTSDYATTHLEQERKFVINILSSKDTEELIQLPYQSTKNTHGTGCSLASAIACHIAQGTDINQAVVLASRYVEAGIRTGPGIGKGSGPLNHFHAIQVMPFAEGGFMEYLLGRDDVKSLWHNFIYHDFVQGMINDSISVESFKRYLIQDYKYLLHFARVQALAGYKAKSRELVTNAGVMVLHIRTEIEQLIELCAWFGLTEHDLEQYAEHQACTAYSRYILDIGQSEDWFALQISLLSCLLGYNVIAKRLREERLSADKPVSYPIEKWISNYSGAEYSSAVLAGMSIVETYAVRQSPHRIEDMARIFAKATTLEIAFWNMAMEAV